MTADTIVRNSGSSSGSAAPHARGGRLADRLEPLSSSARKPLGAPSADERRAHRLLAAARALWEAGGTLKGILSNAALSPAALARTAR